MHYDWDIPVDMIEYFKTKKSQRDLPKIVKPKEPDIVYEDSPEIVEWAKKELERIKARKA